ncbi:MAG: sigma-70 family RNA polymerase sigma factor [Verrucomicrobiae bacterium]|nr:sigma-70 family RNA polymerase sigma factor [Verrucomicrobiae bacterium]
MSCPGPAPPAPGREVPADTPPDSAGRRFPVTHWTVVLAAAAGEGTKSQEALASLCAAYWHPLYAFIRRQGSGPHDAEDLTQEFFRQFLGRNALARVQPAAGRFRSFLLACLKHFLANERERSRAQRRGGGRAPVPLEAGEAETRYQLEPADPLTPEALFERRWALAVLERTLKELRRECYPGPKRWSFDELEGFLPGGRPGLSRAELAARHGVSVGAVDVAVHRLRQRFGTLLREQVARTVSSEAEVGEELRHLIAVLGS